MTDLLRSVTIASIVGTGTMAGLFLAFSTCVLSALDGQPPAQAVAAMNAINVRIVNPVFLLFFLGTALLCAVLAVLAALGDAPGRWWRLAGALAYLAGVIVVTFAVNIPLNNALAAVDPTDPAVAGAWQRFMAGWSPANHLRTVAALIAAALLTVGLPTTPGAPSNPGPSASLSRPAG